MMRSLNPCLKNFDLRTHYGFMDFVYIRICGFTDRKTIFTVSAVTCTCYFSPPVILGVTNPFFAKTLQHWPHIIRIGEMVEGIIFNFYY